MNNANRQGESVRNELIYVRITPEERSKKFAGREQQSARYIHRKIFTFIINWLAQKRMSVRETEASKVYCCVKLNLRKIKKTISRE